MPEIFISYRREDSLSATGRLADKLVERFGAEQVFRDLEAIEAGADFERAILDSVRAATVLLVVIGRAWADARTRDGQRRLDDPGDFVRREIETAFAGDVEIVPVLVEGADMPQADRLPESLRELARRQAFDLSETRWAYDSDRLVRHLEQKLDVEVLLPARPEERGHFVAARLFREAFVPVIVNYVPDLLLLLARPKRLIAKRNFGRKRDLAYALTFLALSLVVTDLLVLAVWPRGEYSIAMILYVSVASGVASTLLLSLPLYGAWRLAGAPRGYHRVAIPFCYQCAVGWLSFMASGAVALTALDLSSPRLVQRIRATLREDTGALYDRVQRAEEAAQLVFQSPEATIGIALGMLIQVCFAAWLIASWGAYRQALGLARWRSALACVVFVAFSWLALQGLVSFARFLAGS